MRLAFTFHRPARRFVPPFRKGRHDGTIFGTKQVNASRIL